MSRRHKKIQPTQVATPLGQYTKEHPGTFKFSEYVAWLETQVVKYQTLNKNAQEAMTSLRLQKEMLKQELDTMREAFDIAEEKVQVPDRCPICASPLVVDAEYMLEHYGDLYTYMPWKEWSFYCTNEEECGEAGTWDEIVSKVTPDLTPEGSIESSPDEFLEAEYEDRVSGGGED